VKEWNFYSSNRKQCIVKKELRQPTAEHRIPISFIRIIYKLSKIRSTKNIFPALTDEKGSTFNPLVIFKETKEVTKLQFPRFCNVFQDKTGLRLCISKNSSKS